MIVRRDKALNELLSNLVKCEKLLKDVGEEFWSSNLRNIIQQYTDEWSPSSIDRILSWYGGMGSFNDLMISTHNGHMIDEGDEEKLNDELDLIRDEIYLEANKLNN